MQARAVQRRSRGARCPAGAAVRLAACLRLAAALGVSVERLAEGVDDPEPVPKKRGPAKLGA
jgi:hypothetical protein